MAIPAALPWCPVVLSDPQAASPGAVRGDQTLPSMTSKQQDVCTRYLFFSLFSLWVLSLTSWFEPLPYMHCRWRPTRFLQLYSYCMFFSSSHTRNICSNNRDATKKPPPSCSLTSGKLALKGCASKSHRHFTLSTGISLQIPAKSQEWALALRSFQAVMLGHSCNF